MRHLFRSTEALKHVGYGRRLQPRAPEDDEATTPLEPQSSPKRTSSTCAQSCFVVVGLDSGSRLDPRGSRQKNKCR